jgi:regulator of protease activity HflC (stomatin/prohibitin superfamily)
MQWFWFWLVLGVLAWAILSAARSASAQSAVVRGFVDPVKFRRWGLRVFLAALVIGLLGTFVRSVPAGHVGVMDFYGWVSGPKMPGLNFVIPFSKLVMTPTRTTQIQEIMDVPSSEGLNVHLDVSVLYHVSPDRAVSVYKSIGKDYDNVFIIPQTRSAARGATVKYEAKALYTSSRELVASEIHKELSDSLLARGFILERVLLRSITLPAAVSDAINEKMAAEQQAERMKFILDKERSEADRKRIEAKGIADFQAIVSAGVTQGLLDWKGIEATEKLAASPNTKIVVIGNPKNGLPLIMGGQ